MKLLKKIIVAVPFLVAQPVFAQDIVPAQVDAFVEIITSNGCSMTEDEAELVFPQNGFDKSLTRAIANLLIGDGVVAFADGRLSIVDGSCSAEVRLTPQQQQFAYILSLNNCAMDQDTARRIFPENGMSFSVADEIADELMDAGIASLSDDGATLILGSEYCTPATSSDEDAGDGASQDTAREEASTPETPMEMPSDGSVSAQFMAVLAQNGCQLSEIDARRIFGIEMSLDMQEIYDLVDQLALEGDLTLIEGGTVIMLGDAVCAAGDAVAVAPTPDVPVETPIEAGMVGDSDDPDAAFLALLGANNCEITQAEAADLIATAGLDFNIMMGVAARMLNDGRASTPDGGQTLQVSAPLCVSGGGVEPSGPKDIFIDLLRANNCSISAGEFSTLLPVDGLDQNTAFGLIAELEAEGVISLPPTRDIVTLTAGNCR